MIRQFNILCILLAISLGTSNLCADAPKELVLDMADVNKLAIENNFDIQIYKLDKSISEKELLKAGSVYDTNLAASYKYDEDELERSSVLLGAKTTTNQHSATLDKTLPTGTVLSLSADHVRQASNSAFSTLNPYHESTASVSITQPFGKNLFGVIDRNTVKITGLDVENTGYTSFDKIEQELADTQKSYWSLLLAYKNRELTKEILVSAQELFANNQKNLSVGLIEAPESYATEANLKQRQRDLLFANENISSALNRIRFKLNLRKDAAVLPKDTFMPEKIDLNFDEILKSALSLRRDYKAAKNTIKSMDLYVQIKKNSLWPQIDLKGTFKRNGLDQKFSRSIKEITSRNQPEYILEVIFSFPLENSQARAEYSQKELEKAKALVSLKKIECLIYVQTNDAYTHLINAYDASKLLSQAKELQHKKYLGEKDRFMKGRSNTDRLIRYQQDYLQASQAYLNSLYDYEAALIDLKTAMNKLLQEDEVLQ